MNSIDLRPLTVVSPLWLCFAAPALADTVMGEPDGFSERYEPSMCDQGLIDFEDATLAAFVGDRYPGVRIELSAGGALVDDDVAGTHCRGSRCVRGPIIADYGADQPPWLTLRFESPVPAVSFWLVDFGDGPDQRLEVEALGLTGEVSRQSIVPGGNDVDGGVFVGLAFDTPATEVRLVSERPGDGMGIDDLWFPPERCLDLDGDGVSSVEGDCDGRDPARHPGADEACDGLDTDCDGALPTREIDLDRDGFLACEDPDQDGVAEADGDCVPFDGTVHPGARETCNGLDDDCDGTLLSGEFDPDRDGWLACEDPDRDGVSEVDGDCAPFDPATHPHAAEVCNGRDDDCDGTMLNGETDADRDGWLSCEDPDIDGFPEIDGDCAPFDPKVNPRAAEICNGIDDNCDGELLPGELDADRDGWLACEDPDEDGYSEVDGDCRPFDADSHPDAPELCDGLDNDCDTHVPLLELDSDRDGWRGCEGDCADGDPTRHPGAVEHENGSDDDCNGEATGGTVGCQVGGGQAAPWTTWLLFPLLFLVRAFRGRAWLLLLVGPAALAAAVVGALDPYRAEIASPAYQEALAAGNFGKQAVVQLSLHSLRDLLIDLVEDRPELGRFQGGFRVPDGDCPVPSCPREFAYDVWLTGMDPELAEHGRVVLHTAIDGLVDDLGFSGHQPVSGPVTIDALLDVSGSCGDADGIGLDIMFTDTDLEGLTFQGYLNLPPFRAIALGEVHRRLMDALAPRRERLDDLVCRHLGGDLTRLLDAPPRVHAPALRTVPHPRSGAEPFLMVGFELLTLPRCGVGTLDVQDLYDVEAFDHFDGSLIPEGGDVAVAFSARVLHEVFWSLVWRNEYPTDNGRRTLQQLIDEGYNMMRDNGMRASRGYGTHWDLDHADSPLPVAAAGGRCDDNADTDRDGLFILSPDGPNAPWIRAHAEASGKKKAWFITLASFKVHMNLAVRFFVDASDPEAPALAVDAVVDTGVSASCGTKCAAGDAVRQTERQTQLAREQIPVLLRGFTQGVTARAGDRTIRLDRLRVLPAAIVLGGALETDTFGRLRAPAPLPNGTIAGLNIGVPESPVLADGADPTQRQCPPGFRSNSLQVQGQRWDYCEFRGTDGGALPVGTWCGLDLRPDLRPELCDDQDNDLDGQVDEGLLRIDPASPPDCLSAYGDSAPPPAFVSTCRGVAPRRGCPPGFDPLPLWTSRAWATCQAPAGPGRGPRLRPAACPDEAAWRAGAELITCVSRGEGFAADAWPALPGGLVGSGYIAGFSPAPPGFGNVPCEPPLATVSQPTGWKVTPLAGRLQHETPMPRLAADAGALRYCTTPVTGADADADGLSDAAEVPLRTDPLRRDSGATGIPDGFAVREDLRAGVADSDADGLNDFEELFVWHTDPRSRDTDQDGLPDAYEVHVSLTDPLDADSDGDDVADGAEESIGDLRSPLIGRGDMDGDGCPDGYERFVTGTSPAVTDTDDNGVPDCQEPAVLAVEDDWYAGVRPERGEAQPPPEPGRWGAGR